ncbi:putative oxidoreductase OrdL [Colletotrichum siamense]|uniref:putative oxidoreductase OrdL n=1 Tax=Colletotrichum siamense TaxID=690259 RepID=UPI00187261EC|nr:putative oxidoreductase OrdL [Colletotrichum siamense]KAF5489963.1 putative oxidoreductase OrdL [Colletotrichum siamense]
MEDQSPIPVGNSTEPFWRTELRELDSHRSTEHLPAECDVLIIGAGFAGTALAHYIHEDNPSPPSVVILEAREACSGATGRGQLKPDVYFNIPKYIEKYGVDAAVEVANFESSQVFAVKELVEKEKIDCDFTLTRTCDATLDEGLAAATEEAFAKLVESGVANLKDVHYTPRAQAEMVNNPYPHIIELGTWRIADQKSQVSGVKGALSCFTFTAGHLWPYKMVMHLLKGVVQKGANLQTHTPVTHISENPLPDGRWEVSTARGSIKAKKVLLATNGYTSHLAPEFKNHIVPVRGICSRIVVPQGETAPYMSQTYSIRHGPSMYDYLIPRNDGSIVVGGAKPTFWADRSQWYNVFDDSKLIEPARTYFDGLMQRTFRGWENSGAYTDKVWAGIMGFSSDFMPYVAKGVVQMLRHGKSFAETGIPSLFQATKERLENTKNSIIDEHGVQHVRGKL